MLRVVGDATKTGPRPPRARRRADRHGARRAPVGRRASPTCAASSSCSSSRSCSGRWRSCAARASSPSSRRCSCASRRSTAPGLLPDTEQQIYHLPADDLYLVGTSEVALASLHAGEILDAADLPLRYAGFSPCFRREAGAAGKDTRGIFRVHQFDKVEMFSFVEPDRSADRARAAAGDRGGDHVGELEIPYRVVNIAVNDLGASAAKKYDIEAWLPGQGRYRELTSTSNTTDFQARRLEIRMRGARAASPRSCTRSTAPRSRSAGRSSRCSRTASARTARSRCPRCSAPYGAPAELPAAGLARDRTCANACARSAKMSNVVVEARDLKQPQHGRVRADDRHAPCGCGHAPQAVEQHAQPGRVDELDPERSSTTAVLPLSIAADRRGRIAAPSRRGSRRGRG